MSQDDSRDDDQLPRAGDNLDALPPHKSIVSEAMGVIPPPAPAEPAAERRSDNAKRGRNLLDDIRGSFTIKGR